MVICLERDADLHIAQLMPLPLTVSCFSKVQIGFTFLVLAHLGSPGKMPINECVCAVIFSFFYGKDCGRLLCPANLTSLSLEETTGHVLATYRPTARWPNMRHQVIIIRRLSVCV